MEKESELKSEQYRIDKWIYSFPILSVITLFYHLLFLFGIEGTWRLIVYYFAPFFIAIIAVIFFIVGVIRSIRKKPYLGAYRLIGLLGLLFFPLSYFYRADYAGTFFNAYPSSHDGKISEVKFEIPIDTTLTVAWGGKSLNENYHVTEPDQRWAYDLFVMRDGFSFKGDSTNLANYFCYGLPIIAPADGKIMEVVDTMPDMAIGDLSEESYPNGNYIVLKVAENEYLLLCHLKPNSIKVKVGEFVKQGKEIASVGNSGHTSEPHLHIQLQDDISYGEGIPLYFYNYIANGKLVPKGIPTGGIDKHGNFVGQTIYSVK